VGLTAHSSNGGYHTFEMEADALGEVAITGSWWMRRRWRRCCTTAPRTRPIGPRSSAEFDGLKGLYGDYLAALRTAYPLPTVPEPTGN